MPGFNRTGPKGEGQGTGKKRGPCETTTPDRGRQGVGQCRRGGGSGRGLGKGARDGTGPGRGGKGGAGTDTTGNTEQTD